jgi:hypothetical protein
LPIKQQLFFTSFMTKFFFCCLIQLFFSLKTKRRAKFMVKFELCFVSKSMEFNLMIYCCRLIDWWREFIHQILSQIFSCYTLWQKKKLIRIVWKFLNFDKLKMKYVSLMFSTKKPLLSYQRIYFLSMHHFNQTIFKLIEHRGRVYFFVFIQFLLLFFYCSLFLI